MKFKLLGDNDFTFNLIGQIGKNRGVEDIDALLSVTQGQCYYPFNLDNMPEAIELIKKHINNKIHIIVDSDCDGVCSATIMFLFLKRIGAKNVTWNNHAKKKHGIYLDELEDFNFDLLIVPDAGSSNYEEAFELKRQGKDILIIDHHESENIPENVTIVNPKLCEYPNKELCGSAVVYKVCEAFDLTEGTNYAPEFLDLVALGSIADMMDSRVLETRFYSSEGLKAINNKMLKALVGKQKFSIGDKLTIVGIQFYIAPLINSVFRSGSIEELDEMFTGFITEEDIKVDYKKRGVGDTKVTIHYDVARKMGLIKNRQDKNKMKLVGPILQIAESQEEDKIHIIDVTGVEDPEMLGLLANDMAQKRQRPVLLVKENKEGLLRGSGRNYSRFEVKELKSFLSTFGFEYIEGHENAFGVGLKKENIESIREKIQEATKDITVEQTFYIDFILDSKSLTKSFIKEIDKLKPMWASNFEEPYVLVKGVICDNATINETGSMLSWTNNGIKFVMFNPSPTSADKLLDKSVECDIIGRVGTNEWKGETTEQVIVSDFTVSKKVEKEIWF